MTDAPDRPLEGLSVLVLEDQYLIACEMERIVAALGGSVIGPAANARSARGLIEHTTPDLALLDVNLDGEHVWDVAQELQSRGVRLIFASGYEATQVPPAFQGELYVEKPVTAKVLVATLETLGLASFGEAAS
jgi:CheY-like chemotaxis protein